MAVEGDANEEAQPPSPLLERLRVVAPNRANCVRADAGRNHVLSFPKLSTHFLNLIRNMQIMEKTDELNLGFESLSNRHILKGFKCVSKKVY